MADPAARLLQLLGFLQTPRSWTATELAARLEVTPRTVRRDVDRLRDLGYPVEATLGAVGGYRLAAGTQMPPLLLDDEEAVAIAVGLRTVVGSAIAGGDEASARALAKLGQVLPPRLRARVAMVSAATRSLVWDESPVEPEQFAQLSRAIANRERVRFDYEAADGSRGLRTVEPNAIVAANRRWYLVAWDPERSDWRSFRLDRIADPRTLAGRVAPRPLPGGDADCLAPPVDRGASTNAGGHRHHPRAGPGRGTTVADWCGHDRAHRRRTMPRSSRAGHHPVARDATPVPRGGIRGRVAGSPGGVCRRPGRSGGSLGSGRLTFERRSPLNPGRRRPCCVFACPRGREVAPCDGSTDGLRSWCRPCSLERRWPFRLA